MIDNDGVACNDQTHCVVCGSEGREIHSGIRDRLFAAPGTWSTIQCFRCGLGWLSPQPLPSEVIKFYGSYHTHAAPDDGGAADLEIRRSPAKAVLRSIKIKLMAALMPWWRLRLDPELFYIGRRKPGRVLDIGCGAGQFLRQAQAAGWDAMGIDFDAEAVAAARQAGANAKASDLFAEQFRADSFDAICMDNVIEHLPNPPAVFAECRRVLRPKGRFVLSTPNIDSYLHELYGQDWRGLETPRHLYLFSATALRKLAKAVGFRHIEVFSTPVLPFNVQLMIEQSKRIATESGRMAPDASAVEYARRAARLSWIRPPKGEYLTLVAER